MDLTSTSATSDIVSFQQHLLDLGFMFRGGADGKLGPATKGAAHDAAVRYSLPPPKGSVYPEALVEGVKALALQHIVSPVPFPPHWIDVTDDAVGEWREHKRPFSEITGVTLHQTGAPMTDVSDTEMEYYQRVQELSLSYTPNLCRWAKHHTSTDKNGRKIFTALRAHFGVTYSGKILYIHPITYMGWHAQRLSHRTVGIEIAGFFRGIESDPHTIPSGGYPRQVVTPAQVEAVKNLVRWIAKYVTQNGGKFTGIFPHRIASDDRRADPGEKVWKEIALPLQEELHLTDGGMGFTMGDGLPIPTAWNPNYSGIDY